MRPSTPEAMVEAEAALRGAVAAVSREHDVHCHVHGGFNRPPKPLGDAATRLFELVRDCGAALGLPPIGWNEIGRAACRDRVCPYVLISVDSQQFKKKRIVHSHNSTTHITH